MTKQAGVGRRVFSFGLELVIYGVLVTAYFFLVLHYLGGWLKDMFDTHRQGYALVALALIIGQGVVLEILTSFLVKLIPLKSK